MNTRATISELCSQPRGQVLTLEDFNTELLTLELRFEHAYLIWDKAGALWSHMSSFAPDLKLVAVQPNQQVLSNKNMQLTLELGLLRLNVRGPKALDCLLISGQELYMNACELLRIKSFSRVGYRCIRTKVYQNQHDASVATQGLAPDANPHSAGDAKQVAFTISRRLESETSGMIATVKLEKREIDISAPWDAMPFMQDVKRTEYVVALDCDYFTIGETNRDALSAELWVAQADRRIKKYWSGILG